MARKQGASSRAKSTKKSGKNKTQNPISVLQQLRAHRFFRHVALRLWNEYTAEARLWVVPSPQLEGRFLHGGRPQSAAAIGRLIRTEIDWPIITAVDVHSDSEDEPGEKSIGGYEIFALLRTPTSTRSAPEPMPQPEKARSKRADYERERSAQRRQDAAVEHYTDYEVLRKALDLPGPADEATAHYRPSSDDDPERRDWEPTESARAVVQAADSVWLKTINSMNGVAQHLNKLGFTTVGSSSAFKANNITPVLVAVELVRGNEYRVPPPAAGR